MKQVTDMTVGKPVKLIMMFALPLILTNLGQQLYMIVDGAIVGRGVGLKALAAVGATDWCYWLILWTVTGLTQGFATFVSRYFGKQDYENMNKTITMSVYLCLIIGAVLTVIGIIVAKPLLKLLNTPDDIINNSEIYLITLIAGTIIVMAYNLTSSILRAFGDGKSPLIAMGIAAVLNVGLDLLFVLVFHWGVFGTAIATIIAQAFSFMFCLFRLKKIEHIQLKKEFWKWDGKLVKELLLFGLPLALQNIVIAVSGIVVQSTINLQGSIFLAGYTAANKLYGLLESTAISLGMSCVTFFAQNYGADKKDRVKSGVKSSSLISVIMAVGIAVIMILLGKFLLQLFIDKSEDGATQSLQIAYRYLVVMSSCLIILYLIHVFRNAMQAMGNSLWSMISGIAECGTRIIMAKAIILWLGQNTLYFIEPAAWLLALLSILIPYLFYQRKLLSNSNSAIQKEGRT